MTTFTPTNTTAQLVRAIGHVGRGGLAILVDPRSGTGDLVLAAARVSAAGINDLATHARGLTELALSPARVALLGLPPMSARWDSPAKPFTLSIEARHGISTGISARDRAETVRVAVAPGASSRDLISPGHVFPLRAPCTTLEQRRDRTVAALTLAQLAGCGEGAVLSSILDDAGDLARGVPLRALADRLRIGCIDLDELAAYEASLKTTPEAARRPGERWLLEGHQA